jgi:hypothetical protein
LVPSKANRSAGEWTTADVYALAKAAEAYSITDVGSALRAFYIAKGGTIELYSSFMLDVIYQHFGDSSFIWVEAECDKTRATCLYKRPAWPDHQKRVYTIQNATDEGLMKPGQKTDGGTYETPWLRYTAVMLRWCLVRRVAKDVFPEVRYGRERAQKEADVAVLSKYPSLTQEREPGEADVGEGDIVEEHPELASATPDNFTPDLEAETDRERYSKVIYDAWAKDKQFATKHRDALRTMHGTDDLSDPAIPLDTLFRVAAKCAEFLEIAALAELTQAAPAVIDQAPAPEEAEEAEPEPAPEEEAPHHDLSKMFPLGDKE